MSKFQIILTAIFGVFLVGGVIIFSVYRGNSKNAVTVTVWGTIPEITFNDILEQTSLYQSKEIKVQYTQKSEENFDNEFIDALASGVGPDVFMLPSDKIIKHRNKIYAIPYNVFSQRSFRDSFIEGAEVYMAPEGVLAMPVYVDPLVMYWNRQMFTDAKLTEPPKYWDEFYDLASLITKKDGALNIQKSAVALGEFSNISHAKEIFLNLAMQAGTPVANWGGKNPQVVFSYNFGKPMLPAEAAVNFYTEFSNPAKSSYSWNRSMPNSTDYFLSDNLALYFGSASEIRNLQLKNPNLNFDVAPVPVSREGGTNVSFADFYAFAISKSTRSPSGSYSVVSALSSSKGAAAFSSILKLPPARRDLLGKKAATYYETVFNQSAIMAKTWLDLSPNETNAIFKTMIESITSGRARVGEAIIRVNSELSAFIK